MPMAPETNNAWLAAAGLLFLTALVASLAAWLWALGRLFARQRLLPAGMPAIAPDSWLPRIGFKAAAGVVLLYFVILPEVLKRFWASTTVPQSANMYAHDQIILSTLVNLFAVLLVPRVLRGLAGVDSADLGFFNRSLGSNVRIGLVTCLLASPFVYGIFLAATQIWPPAKHPVFETITSKVDPQSALLALLSAVVAAPLAEELVFRGVLLGWLTRLARADVARAQAVLIRPVTIVTPEPPPPLASPEDSVDFAGAESEPDLAGEPPAASRKHSFWVAWVPNILLSILFASMHAPQWPAPIPLFCLSLVLGWLVLKTGSLVPAIVLHAGFNGFSTVVTLLATLGGAVPGGSKEVQPRAVPTPAPAVLAVAPATTLEMITSAAQELTRSAGDLGCEWWHAGMSAHGRAHASTGPSRHSSPRDVQDRKWTNEAPRFCATWKRSAVASRTAPLPPPPPPTT
jgi:membrane protease YdiL (CAAX protease family)